MRENSFARPVPLQIGNGEEAAAIDPKAEGIDLTPLLDLLVDNEEVLKVFHAGGQDIEIIYNLTGRTPHPLFDTQIAAMALGLGEQVGYSNLVESLLGRNLDKGARFTDWARRPLDLHIVMRRLVTIGSSVPHAGEFATGRGACLH